MADYNNIVTAPVSVQKVARLLGTSKLSVGNLCTSDRINMWAKYKPFNSNFIAFGQNSDATKNDKDLELKRANYGITMMTDVNFETFRTKLLSGDWQWTYAPRTAPFRLGDFINYNHAAENPVGDIDVSQSIPIVLDGGMKFTIAYDANPVDPATNLRYTDIIGSMMQGAEDKPIYFGVIMMRDAIWKVATSTYAFTGDGENEGETQIVCNVGNPSAYIGDWNIIPFFSIGQRITFESNIDRGFFFSANKGIARINIKDATGGGGEDGYIYLIVEAIWQNDYKGLNYSVNVYNNYSSSRQISGIEVYVMNEYGDLVASDSRYKAITYTSEGGDNPRELFHSSLGCDNQKRAQFLIGASFKIGAANFSAVYYPIEDYGAIEEL